MLEIYCLEKEVFNLVGFDIAPKKRKVTITLHLERFKMHEKPIQATQTFTVQWLHFCVGNNINFGRLRWQKNADRF